MVKRPYDIIFSNQAYSFIKKADKNLKDRLGKIFSTMTINPFHFPFKKIKGQQGLFRIRVGDYRIIYEVSNEQNLITVLKINHRKKAYKGL